MNNLHNLHSFHFVFAKAVLLRCPAKLGSPWLMIAIPIGEGWARHNNELLVHPPSQVYFAQRGDQRGKYLLKTGQGFSVCPAPHVGNLTGLELRMS